MRSTLAGKVGPDDFLLGESARVPAGVTRPNRNYMNLLEAPLLFYAVCLICFATTPHDRVMVMLAWLYVGLRLVHSVIHVTYNNVFHRLSAFGASVASWSCLSSPVR